MLILIICRIGRNYVEVTGLTTTQYVVFYTVLFATLCSAGGRSYSLLGAYSQNDHLISLVMYNKLYNQSCSRCVSYISKTSAFYSLKPTPRAHVRAGPLCPKPRETHGNERARPDNTYSDRHHCRQSGLALTGSLCSLMLLCLNCYDPPWTDLRLMVADWLGRQEMDGLRWGMGTPMDALPRDFSPLWNR